VLCWNAPFRYGMYSWRISRSERRAQTPVVVLDAHPARVAAKAIKAKKGNWRIGFYARVMVNLKLLCSCRREAPTRSEQLWSRFQLDAARAGRLLRGDATHLSRKLS
jgi:hypothetical protein